MIPKPRISRNSKKIKARGGGKKRIGEKIK
jgi:hypothetical protein